MTLKNKGDFILSFAAFFHVAVLMLQELLVAASIIEHESFRKFSVLLAAVPTVVALFYVIKREPFLFFITYGLISYISLLTLILFPDNKQYMISGSFYLLCINVPCFLCIVSIKEIFILKKVMLLLSYIIFVLGVFYFYLLTVGKITFLSYSMTFSYYLLLPALVFLNQKKIQFTFMFILICILMLMLGSRGALFIALVYAFLVTMLDNKVRKYLILAVIILGISAGRILTFILTMENRIGVESRTLNMLMQGNITDSSERFYLYSKIWNDINDNPYFGKGIFGDRVILRGEYSHNIILEVLNNFGLIIGSGLILLLLFAAYRTFYNLNNESKRMLLLFFCYGILPLMVSGSYLIQAGFGLFLGSLFLYKNHLNLRVTS